LTPSVSTPMTRCAALFAAAPSPRLTSGKRYGGLGAPARSRVRSTQADRFTGWRWQWHAWTRPRYTSLTREVYDACMAKVRTNIELEDDYVRAIMDRYGVHTKTEAVDLALRHLAGQPMTREQALAMRGTHAIDDVPVDVSPRGAA
jgi:Arc/MetJ family transcription regulator